MKSVYADHSATTYVKKEVLDAMLPYFTENFGNASSIYKIGRDNKAVLSEARACVAKAIGAEENEIFFTSSGSEADNWAIKGVFEANSKKGKHIITSKIEHPAVLNTLSHLEKLGARVTYVDVDEFGVVSPESIEKAICDDTILISVMLANNEIGTIEPIAEIGKIAAAHNVVFHTDAVQAVGIEKIDVKELGVNLLTMSAHKFYGPKGIGALYIKKGTKISNLVDGGAQEMKKRAGTENLPAIVGMAKAISLACENIDERRAKLSSLRDEMQRRILAEIPYSKVNGSEKNRLPGVLNVSFEFIEGESLLMMLDRKGVMASTGSACSSQSLEPSHVLLSIGLPHELAHGSLRLSFGDGNTKEDIDFIMDALKPTVERLRAISPLYEEIERGTLNV